MATTKESLENSIYWQKVVLSQSNDIKQKERAKQAIERLTEELKKISKTPEGIACN